jgi:hypothetical protein
LDIKHSYLTLGDNSDDDRIACRHL